MLTVIVQRLLVEERLLCVPCQQVTVPSVWVVVQAKMQLNGSRASGGSDPRSLRGGGPHVSSDGHPVIDEDQRSLVLQVSEASDQGAAGCEQGLHCQSAS
jgi:hypothetical protein